MADNFDPKTIRVALLAGGKSGEREISLKSGEGAKGALLEAGFDVTMMDPANKADLHRLIDEDWDVAFLTTHGRGGEDGRLQGFLETIGVPYTGCGVYASALAMNKARAKETYYICELPTPDFLSMVHPDDFTLEEILEVVGENCVVKAVNEGSTLGVYICKQAEEIMPAVEEAFKIDDEVLIERFIPGDEFTVAVLGDEDCEALPVIQIIPKNEFYDFESKYAAGGSQHLCPAPISEELSDTMMDLAERTHLALGCSGVSRTDFIVDADGQCWILETNTLPGMTATSLLPDAARAAGISFPELCTRLVQGALAK